MRDREREREREGSLLRFECSTCGPGHCFVRRCGVVYIHVCLPMQFLLSRSRHTHGPDVGEAAVGSNEGVGGRQGGLGIIQVGRHHAVLHLVRLMWCAIQDTCNAREERIEGQKQGRADIYIYIETQRDRQTER